MGSKMPMTPFYLELLRDENAVLLWSAEEEYPMATLEMEREYLHQHVFKI